jgi:hypothetical protein
MVRGVRRVGIEFTTQPRKYIHRGGWLACSNESWIGIRKRISAKVEAFQRRQLPNLARQRGQLVSAEVKAFQRRQLPDLARQRGQLVSAEVEVAARSAARSRAAAQSAGFR